MSKRKIFDDSCLEELWEHRYACIRRMDDKPVLIADTGVCSSSRNCRRKSSGNIVSVVVGRQIYKMRIFIFNSYSTEEYVNRRFTFWQKKASCCGGSTDVGCKAQED